MLLLHHFSPAGVVREVKIAQANQVKSNTSSFQLGEGRSAVCRVDSSSGGARQSVEFLRHQEKSRKLASAVKREREEKREKWRDVIKTNGRSKTIKGVAWLWCSLWLKERELQCGVSQPSDRLRQN
jgi:hypothetical protein